jgi:hypothetical protein
MEIFSDAEVRDARERLSSVQRRLVREAAEPMDRVVRELLIAINGVIENAKEFRRLNPDADVSQWVPPTLPPELKVVVNWEELFERAK